MEDLTQYPLQIQKSVELLRQMQQNAQENYIWKNVAAGRQVAGLLDEIPDRGEAYSPYDKIFLLNILTDNIPCSDVPRFTLSVFEKMLVLFDFVQDGDCDDYDDTIERKDVEHMCRKWRDYIDCENITNREWIKSYGRHLRFDPVERTPLWEELYEKIEEEVDAEIGPDTYRGMGFCHHYWYVKADVLGRYGIEWKSPSEMNPGVMFD